MKRAALALCLVLVGCSRDPGAIQAVIQIDPKLLASCIALDVVSSDGTVLHSRLLARPADRNELRIAIFRGDLPQELQLQARALWGATCEDVGALRTNGRSRSHEASFEPEKIHTVPIELSPPSLSEDADQDGFVSDQLGGPDCDDGRTPRNPSAQEVCDGSEDLNCNGSRGCDDASCPSTACARMPTSLVFTSLPQVVRAGQCAGPIVVQRNDSRNEPATPQLATPVELANTFPSGTTFHADADCARPLSSPAIAPGSSTLSFYVRGIRLGAGELTATSSGLQPATLGHTLIPGLVSKLVFTSPPRSPKAGECAPITVERRDEFDNPTSGTVQALTLTPAPSAQATLYQDAGCATPLNTPLFSAQDSAFTFYFRATRKGSFELSASALQVTGDKQTQFVKPGDPKKLVLGSSTGQTLLAGECSSSVPVGVLDEFDNETSFLGGTTLALSAQPAEGFGFHTDTQCTGAPTPTLTIPEGVTNAGFRFKGRTGGTVTITVSSPTLGQVTQSETVIPAVRRGDCLLKNGDTSVDCALPVPLRNRDQAFLIFQASTSNNTPDSAFVRCALPDKNKITCDRHDKQGNANIQWQVVELPRGLRVQHHQVNCTGETTSVTINPVLLEKTFVLFSATQNGTVVDSNDIVMAQLVGNTRVDISNTGGCAPTRYALQVVELDGLSVTRGVAGPMDKDRATLDVTGLATADSSHSVLLSSFKTTVDRTDICNRMVRGDIVNDTQLRFTRAAGNTSCDLRNPISAISWERITFPSHVLVHTSTLTANGGSNRATAPLPAGMDTTRTLLLSSSQSYNGQGGGESAYTGDDIIGVATGRHLFTSDGNLEILRDNSSGDAKWTSSAIQFEP
ncbi:putative metal-binding motif-containing protein [Archangium lipolyticum]|uniref:putative metal-binding motif-containing protein n=1 Tax=Archangium lipolyticum TaxID=2970465 RepID=UPI00214A6E95|nr:putative metal-binding motif-containing protein [Archangium lipolyticum]